MERLRKLRADVEAFFARLAPRERLFVALGAAAVAVFILMAISLRMSSSISSREHRIGEKTRVLSEVGKLTQGYRAAQAERAAIEAKLKGPPLQLMSYVSQTGTRLGIEVNDLRPGTPGGGDGIVEDSVEVNLVRIDLSRLARLLSELERGPGVVKVRRLRVSTRNDDPSLVDVTLVVATYQMKGGRP